MKKIYLGGNNRSLKELNEIEYCRKKFEFYFQWNRNEKKTSNKKMEKWKIAYIGEPAAPQAPFVGSGLLHLPSTLLYRGASRGQNGNWSHAFSNGVPSKGACTSPNWKSSSATFCLRQKWQYHFPSHVIEFVLENYLFLNIWLANTWWNALWFACCVFNRDSVDELIEEKNRRNF